MTLALGSGKKGTCEMKAKNRPIGVANCLRLHIHTEPNKESEIVCKVRYLTELELDLTASTEDYYKVFTATGAEGFCQKEYITVK